MKRTLCSSGLALVTLFSVTSSGAQTVEPLTADDLVQIRQLLDS